MARFLALFQIPLPPPPDPDICSYLNPYVSYNVVPQFYKSPPYLHAVPEVTYHRLTPRDRFLVIASDGLWDMMTPSQVVNVVGSWKRGIQSLKPFELPEVSCQFDY